MGIIGGLNGYTLQQRLHDGAVFVLDRAIDPSGAAVVLKRLPAERYTPADEARLRQELAALAAAAGPGVVRARGIEAAGGELALVLEDAGGVSLASLLAARRLPPAECLALAIALAQILGEVHRRGVLHKDLKPRNILLLPDGSPQLIDFGIAARVAREDPALRATQAMEGTLAYMAPEQTGRMNRPIDARSDLYSLGATLYEVACGRPPFTSQDPLELVHAHVARLPTAPHEIDPATPRALSAVLCKLLAKDADDRYQSGFGLKADLERCAALLAAGREAETFPLGQDDRRSTLRAPARLYGRSAEQAALQAAAARVSAGALEVVTVVGAPGLGKSTLIQELRRWLGPRGCFAAGKFEALERDQPYVGLREALRAALEEMMTSPPEVLAHFRAELLTAVGRHLAALYALLPELAAVLAVAPTSAPAGVGAARGQIEQGVIGLLRALTGPGAALVLFLDDLQWADRASLDLLVAALAEPELRGLLVVGSYRPEEVNAEHPLRGALDALATTGCPRSELVLGPLDEASVAAMVADALGEPLAAVEPLALLIHDRSGGNPLFVGEFLREMHAAGLLDFDPQLGVWRWDLEGARRAALSEDIAALMAARAEEAAPRSRAALEAAACAGGRFDVALLVAATGETAADVAEAMREAAAIGLVVPIGDELRFFHDRVRDAVLSRTPPARREALHLALGRAFLARSEITGRGLFAAVDHFGAAKQALHDPQERLRVASLAASAARRARASAAFAATARYAALGAACLPGDGWTQERALAFELHRLRAEAELLCGEYTAAQQLFATLLARASSASEAAEIYELKVSLLTYRGRLHEAVAEARVGLKGLGIELPTSPGVPAMLAEFMKTRLAMGRRSPEAIMKLPPLTDPKALASMRLIFALGSAAFQVSMPLMTVIALRATRMTLLHGLSPLAAAQVISYGLMLGAISRDYAAMDRYGLLALQILDRLPDRQVEGLVRTLYGALIQSWCHPVRESFAVIKEAIQATRDTGQPLLQATGMSALATQMWFAGCPLDQVLDAAERASAFHRQARLGPMAAGGGSIAAAVVALQGGGPAGLRGELPQADESPDAARLIRVVDLEYQLEVAVIRGEFAEAEALAKSADPEVRALLAFSLTMVTHHAYWALAVAAQAGRSGRDRRGDLRTIRRAAAKLSQWKALCPENFAALSALVAAELARIEGDAVAAIRGYEEAAALAIAGGLTQVEAICYETSSRFYAAARALTAARSYAARARRAYSRWGATAKVAALDAEYPGLERGHGAPPSESGATSIIGELRSDGGSSGEPPVGWLLDASSLLKATQAFAAELDLERLLDLVMAVVVENSGGERGTLLLARDGGLVARRRYEAHGQRHEALGDLPLTAPNPPAPAPFVLLALRSGRPLSSDDLSQEQRFARDPYVITRKPRSAAVVPLVYRGEALGALYVENNLTTAAFTTARVEMTRLIALQAAIAVKHALFLAHADAARAAAESANLAKSRFLANMSHELRTPLNAILGYAELVREAAADAGAAGLDEDLGRIVQSGQHLLGIIGDVLDLTKIESDQLEVAHERVDVAAVLHEAAMIAEPALRARGNRLNLAISAESGRILGDAQRLRQVALALLDNAGKFTEAGVVTLRALPLADAVEIVVEDTGVGMTEADQAEIFAPFVQADTSSTRIYGGAGLGLTICKGICERMGGTITLRSRLGAGTTVTVRLPAALP
jgi:predicted ATPase/signal transduction histidine kinase